MPFLVHSSRQRALRWRDASDRELLEAVQRGDESAFDQLIERKASALARVAWRIVGDREEARDIVQLAFLRVWEHRRKFKRRWSPNTWLYRITTNLAIDHLRSRRSRDRHAEPFRAHLREVAGGRQRTHLAELQEREVTAIFERLSTCLTERQRLVFLLRAMEGMSSQEVGGILGCRASTVRNHLFAARKRLREELARLYPEYLPPADRTEDPQGEDR